MPNERVVDIDEAFRLRTPIDRAIAQAGREAVLDHQRTGIPLVYFRNGRVVYIDAYTKREVPTLDPVPRPTA
jgi:hypothetical protein